MFLDVSLSKFEYVLWKSTFRLDLVKYNPYVPAEMKLLYCTSSFFFYLPDHGRWGLGWGRWLVRGLVFPKKNPNLGIN